MEDPQRSSPDEVDTPADRTRPALPPSRFGAGYTVGHSPQYAAAPVGGWPAAGPAGTFPPSALSDFQSHPRAGTDQQSSSHSQPPWPADSEVARSISDTFPAGDSAAGLSPGRYPGEPRPSAFSDSAAFTQAAGLAAPLPPQRHNNNGVLLLAAVGAVIVACGSFFLGRVTAPNTAPGGSGQAGAAHSVGPTTGAAPGGAPTISAAPGSTGLEVTDPAGDAVPHAVDGKIYGPSDIVNLSVRSDGTNLIIITTYTPSTPMSVISGGMRIRLDPDAVPSCKDSVLDSFDWSIDYDTGGLQVSKPGANCGDKFEPTTITGASAITGSTLTIKIRQDSLGISSGQRIVIRGCVSTRIDDGHTTFIQDWAPDSPSGTTGAV